MLKHFPHFFLDALKEKERKLKGKKKADDFFEEHALENVSDGLTFVQMNLSRPILKVILIFFSINLRNQAIGTAGFTDPTPIQEACIPVALTGKDICK